MGLKWVKFQKKNNIRRQDIVLTLSTFAPRKGILEFLDVIEKVSKTNKNIRFLLAGRDEMNGQVRKIVKLRKLEEFVKILGFVEDIKTILKKSKLLVIPSRLPEGCPTSALEAMSHGVPVLGYNIFGVNEVIIDRSTGYLIEPFNSKALANKIVELIKDKNKLELFDKNGRIFLRENFTIDKMLSKHRKVFNT